MPNSPHRSDSAQDHLDSKIDSGEDTTAFASSSAPSSSRQRHSSSRQHHGSRPSSPDQRSTLTTVRSAGTRGKHAHTLGLQSTHASSLSSTTSASLPPPLFAGVLVNNFKRARTTSPPTSIEESEDETEVSTAQSSRSNSISSNAAEAPSLRSHFSTVKTSSSPPPQYPNSTNVTTPLRFSFGISDTPSIPVAERAMRNADGRTSANGGIDGTLTDAMLSLKHGGGDASTASSSPAAATLNLPSYSQAMGQSVEVHSPTSEENDGATCIEPALVPKPPLLEQYSVVIELQKQPLQHGASWFVVDRTWFRLWSTVCSGHGDNDTVDALGPIDTTTLLDTTFPLALKTGLEEKVDFEVLPREAWDLLVRWYGRRGRAIERKVITMPGSSVLRLELFPPILHVYYAAAQAVAPATVSLSITESLSSLKSAITQYVEQHLHSAQQQQQQQSQWRFWRLPHTVSRAASLAAKDISALDGKELISPENEAATLAELQIDQPVEQLVVEAKIGDQAWPLGPDGKGATPSLKGVFRQDGNDFLSKLQRGEASSTAASSSSFPLDAEPSVGRITRSQTAAERGPDRQQGLTGLYNLGNTCFMNAALQCMSNTKELKDYFVSGVYKSEVNASNPLGMGGAMAKVFGELLSKLWGNGGGAWHPREFKTVLSRFSPQFIGYAQQDTQELLAFLLDGLHEDLNRIVKKPYIEAPDWEGGGLKEMVTFARKQWEIYKMRNDSVIVDLFQGQYRSTLVCPDCGKVSIKFDPFMYLTLPIPNRKSIVRKVTFIPCQGDPVTAEMRLTPEMSFAHLKRTLATWFDASLDTKCLVACDVFNRSFYRVYSDFDAVADIALNDVTWVYELPSPLLPIAPVPKVTQRYSSLSSQNDDHISLEEKTAPPATKEEVVNFPVFSLTANSRNTYGPRGKTNFGEPLFISVPGDKANDVTAIQEAVMQAYLASASDRDALQKYLTRLRETSSSSSASEDWDMLDESKIVVPATEQTAATDEETVAEITDDGNTVRIVPDSRSQGKEPQAGSSTASTAANVFSLHFLLHREDHSPFTLKPDFYDTAGEELTVRARRLGHLGSDEKPISNGRDGASASWPLIYTGAALVCVWTSEARETFFGENDEEWSTAVRTFIDPELEAERRPDSKRSKRTLTIDDCLNEFTKEEQLGESDPWYCPQCKDFKQATKKFDLWKVPDILVVHLKRFSSGRISRDKIDSLIDFPINGLDLTDRVEGAKAVQELLHGNGDDDSEQEDKLMESISSLDANDDAVEMDAPVYDLYAVDNHYGGLGGGHYTAFAKNPEQDKWYYFDDSSVRPVRDVDEAKSSAAYLLFYRRRTTRPIGGKSREKVRQRVKDDEAAARQAAGAGGSGGRPGLRSQHEDSIDDQQGKSGTDHDDEEMDTDMTAAQPTSNGRAKLGVVEHEDNEYAAPLDAAFSRNGGGSLLWGDEDDESAAVRPTLEGQEENDEWTRIWGSTYRRPGSTSSGEAAQSGDDGDDDNTSSIRVSLSSDDGERRGSLSSSSFVQFAEDNKRESGKDEAHQELELPYVPPSAKATTSLAHGMRAGAIDSHLSNTFTVAPL